VESFSCPVKITITEDLSDEASLALSWEYEGERGKIFQNPDFNRTPVQAQKLFKLKKSIGNAIDFYDREGVLRASLCFDAAGDLSLDYFSADNQKQWEAIIVAADTVPDPFMRVFRSSFSYRWLAPSLLLFLFLLLFCCLVIDSSYGFWMSVGFTLLVVISVFVLTIIRNRSCK
jgi:hypothetical protein